jgi:predicted Zn-dependent peptidase
MKQEITTERLKNGMDVVIEEIPQLRSVSLGLWVTQGSRHEDDDQAGISHLIEHLVFKGTQTLSCREIADAIDRMGGNLDAVTDREYTGYFAKVLDTHFEDALSLLAEITSRPLFSEDDLKLERGVILEEIKMVQDSPDDQVHEIFMETFFDGHPLGRSVLGSEGTVVSISRDGVEAFFGERYRPENMLLAVAGGVSAGEVLGAAERHLGSFRPGTRGAAGAAPTYRPGLSLRERNSMEQVQLLLGANAFPKTDQRRHALNTLNTYLGATVSSRLFQNVREQRGLAYAISSFTNTYKDCGLLGIYAATGPERLQELVDVVLTELSETAAGEIDKSHIERVKACIKGDVLLGLENSANRMSFLARQLIYFGVIKTIDEVLDELDCVRVDDVARVAETVFRGAPMTIVALGNLDGWRIDSARLVVP